MIHTIIQRAYEELDEFGWSEQELVDYEAVVKRDMDHQAILDKRYNDGKAEGEINFLIKLLEKKFPGNVTEKHINALKSANSETLEKFADNILTAVSIDDVFVIN